MEFKSISAKLPVNELTLFKDFCKRKGVFPSSLIRDLILKEMEIPIPHTVAGKNRITYAKHDDSFTWSVELDTGAYSEIIRDISPSFLEELQKVIETSLEERNSFIAKKQGDSIPVPSKILRGEK